MLLKIFAVIALFAGIVCAADSKKKSALKPTDTLWIDVRTPQEYQQGHLKGAPNIPLQDFEVLFPKQGWPKDQVIALYCRSGNRSGQALHIALALGYTRAFNAGGFASLAIGRKTEP